MNKPYHKQCGFKVVLKLEEGNEMTPEHVGKLIITLGNFGEKWGYNIELLETIVKGKEE